MNQLLDLVTKTLSDLKLKDIRIFKFTGFSPYFDYQVIASATNERQVHASISHFQKAIPSEKQMRMEGQNEDRWILFDFGDIIVHVMHQDDRNYYQLEKCFFDKEEIFIEGITREL